MEKTFDLIDLEKITKNLLSIIKKGVKNGATILAFSGDLGAGKTTTTKEIARQLGVKERVISPTFVIMKKYKTKDLKHKNLIHIDAYRLNKSEELLRLGWEEMIANKNNLIIVEWPERVIECLPKDIYNLKLEHKDDTTRTLKLGYNI